MPKAEKPKRGKKQVISTKIITTSGKTAGEVVLPRSIFAVRVNERLLAQAVHVYRARQRQGTSVSKTRGQVRGSGRKIYRQKGTGRARHGDRQAPIFVGGGIAHGPKLKGEKPILAKKLRRQALFGALTSKFTTGMMTVVDNFTKLPARTKALVEILSKIGVPAKESILLVLPKKIENINLAGRNIQRLTITPAPLLNAYQVLRHKRILVTKEALSVLEKTFRQEKEVKVKEKPRGKKVKKVS